jgi:ribonucleotide monophosphatase NagD (HAD superfamily)
MCARKSYLRFDVTGMHETGASTAQDISGFMNSCLFIGDTPKMDYFGPIKAGMCACLYLAGNTAPEGIDRINTISSYRSCVGKDGVRLGRYFLPFYEEGAQTDGL